MVGLTNGNLWGLIESLEIHHGITQIQIGIFFHFCFKWLFIYTVEMKPI